MSDLNFPLEVVYQDTFDIVLTVQPGGVPVDWNDGSTMDGQLRADADETSIADFTFTPDLTLPATGNTHVTLDTTSLKRGVYSYSFRLKNPSGAIRTMLKGNFAIVDSPTTTGGTPNP